MTRFKRLSNAVAFVIYRIPSVERKMGKEIDCIMIIILTGGLFLDRPETFRVTQIFVSSMRTRFKLWNLAVILLFLVSEKYQKSSFSRQGDNSYKNCFSGPISYRVFRETAPGAKRFFSFFFLFASGNVKQPVLIRYDSYYKIISGVYRRARLCLKVNYLGKRRFREPLRAQHSP